MGACSCNFKRSIKTSTQFEYRFTSPKSADDDRFLDDGEGGGIGGRRAAIVAAASELDIALKAAKNEKVAYALKHTRYLATQLQPVTLTLIDRDCNYNSN